MSRKSGREAVPKTAYAVACIDCERIALIRTSQNLGDRLYRYAARRNSGTAHLTDSHGFLMIRQDTLFFTYCDKCERSRATDYSLELAYGQYESRLVHARVANPYIARSFLDAWPVLHRVQRDYTNGRLDPGDHTHRPIIKIEWLTWAWGFTGLGRYDDPPPEVRNVVHFNGNQWVSSDRRFFYVDV